MKVEKQGGEIQRGITARQIARDGDVGWGRAFIQQVLDGGARLVKLGRGGLFRCEGYGQVRNINPMLCQKTHQNGEGQSKRHPRTPSGGTQASKWSPMPKDLSSALTYPFPINAPWA